MNIDLLPRALCHELLVDLASKGVYTIPANDSRVEAALSGVLDIVEEQCKQAYAAGNYDFADECLLILDQLGPDGTTGRHDLFWAKLRELQPGAMAFGNPTYRRASLPKRLSNAPTYQLSQTWKSIIHRSSDTFVEKLGK